MNGVYQATYTLISSTYLVIAVVFSCCYCVKFVFTLPSIVTVCPVLLLKVVLQRSLRQHPDQSEDAGTSFQRTLHQRLRGDARLSYRYNTHTHTHTHTHTCHVNTSQSM